MIDLFHQIVPQLTGHPELFSLLIEKSEVRAFEKGQILLQPNQSISHIPIVLEGLIKVFKKEESGSEVLLYYISSGQGCIMSFNSLINKDLSIVKAVTETKTTVLLVTAETTLELLAKYPQWNQFFHQLYRTKYQELIDVIEVLTFSNKQERIMDYLRREATLKGSLVLKTTHQKIADDLGSSREVISRILKKLEIDQNIKLSKGIVELIN